MDQIHLGQPTEPNPQVIVQTTRQRFVDAPGDFPFWVLFRKNSPLMGDIVYLFSSQFHADKFVQQSHLSDDFTLSRASEEVLSNVRKQHQQAEVVINPCIHCEHQTKISINESYPVLLTKLTEVLVNQLLLSLDELSTAQDLIEEENYQEASEILVRLVTHLNPGLAEAHYLLGAIAVGSNENHIAEQVETNLARMSDKWHQRFISLRNK